MFHGKDIAHNEGLSLIEPGTNFRQTGQRKPVGESFPWHDTLIWSYKHFWQNVCEHGIPLGVCNVSMQIGHGALVWKANFVKKV